MILGNRSLSEAKESGGGVSRRGNDRGRGVVSVWAVSLGLIFAFIVLGCAGQGVEKTRIGASETPAAADRKVEASGHETSQETNRIGAGTTVSRERRGEVASTIEPDHDGLVATDTSFPERTSRAEVGGGEPARGDVEAPQAGSDRPWVFPGAELPRDVSAAAATSVEDRERVGEVETDEPGGAPFEGGRPRDQRAKSLPIPLVDDVGRLQLLHPLYPVWIDPVERVLIVVGEICQTDVPLELFACRRGSKEHESIVVTTAPAYLLHAGLLVLGAEAGSPVQFHPEFRPASGSEIEILVRWREESGELRQCRAQDWVQDISGMYQMYRNIVANQFEDELHPHDQWEAWKTMSQPWVFAGSLFVRDEHSGREIYLADQEGVLICVANFPSALLDVPIESSTVNAALMFRCFTERIPPIGTQVTLILKPAELSPTPSVEESHGR